MGTDIHLFIETRGPDGAWSALRPPEEFSWQARYNRLELPFTVKEGTEEALAWTVDRNYDLFALLADVRNGVGFAGADTGDGFTPIAMPRGLPLDLSAELQACDLRVDHTPSHLTLEEIAEYPLWRDGTTKHRGWVDAYTYRHWVVEQKRSGAPVAASGRVTGGSVRLVEQAELDRSLDAIPAVAPETLATEFFPTHHPLFDGIYTVVQWSSTYRESAGPQWWRLFEVLQGYGLNAANVRLVFYFDS